MFTEKDRSVYYEHKSEQAGRYCVSLDLRQIGVFHLYYNVRKYHIKLYTFNKRISYILPLSRQIWT